MPSRGPFAPRIGALSTSAAACTIIEQQRASNSSVLTRRFIVLPLVCKQWARILGQPSAAWECGVIDLQALYNRECERDTDVDFGFDNDRLRAWFHRCATACW